MKLYTAIVLRYTRAFHSFVLRLGGTPWKGVVGAVPMPFQGLTHNRITVDFRRETREKALFSSDSKMGDKQCIVQMKTAGIMTMTGTNWTPTSFRNRLYARRARTTKIRKKKFSATSTGSTNTAKPISSAEHTSLKRQRKLNNTQKDNRNNSIGSRRVAETQRVRKWILCVSASPRESNNHHSCLRIRRARLRIKHASLVTPLLIR